MVVGTDTWLNIDDTCEYLSISRAQLYRMLRRGELAPDGRAGARHRFSRDYLDQYVKISNSASVNKLELCQLKGVMRDADQEGETPQNKVSGYRDHQPKHTRQPGEWFC